MEDTKEGLHCVYNYDYDDKKDSDEFSVLELHISTVKNGFLLDVSGVKHEWREVYTSKSSLLERVEELI